jgi:sporulation protein YlmC with PRC-barrel domain
MKLYRFSPPAALLVVLAFIAAQAFAGGYGSMEKSQGLPPEPVSGSAGNFESTRASSIIGTSVMNNEGENLGAVRDLVIGPDGSVTYLIIGHGGLLGLGETLSAVPWTAARAYMGESGMVVSMSKAKMENAPSFSSWDAMEKADFQQRVRAYYGERTPE